MKTALTIGFFDGVHIGHQALLRRLRKHPHTTILTFSNHPQSILKPPAPPLLLSLEKRLELLKSYANELIVLPFTLELANTPFDILLSRFDLNFLILGEGSTFGKNREGDETRVRHFALSKGFNVEYFPKLIFNKEPVSSSRIRKAIQTQDFQLAHQLMDQQ